MSIKRSFKPNEKAFILTAIKFATPKQIADILGKDLSKVKEYISAMKKECNIDVEDSIKNMFSEAMLKKWFPNGKMPVKKRRGTRNNVSGVREDLKMFFRSKMEANLARVLNIKYPGKWTYESEWFELKPNKKGRGRNYLPDFIVNKEDGTRFLIEVKGYFFPGDRQKLRKMVKEHPEEKILVMTKRVSKGVIEFSKKMGFDLWFYEDLAEQYNDKIPNWE